MTRFATAPHTQRHHELVSPCQSIGWWTVPLQAAADHRHAPRHLPTATDAIYFLDHTRELVILEEASVCEIECRIALAHPDRPAPANMCVPRILARDAIQRVVITRRPS